MFITRRILLKNKLFANFICTSNALSCKKSKDETEGEKQPNVQQKTTQKVRKKEEISTPKGDVYELIFQTLTSKDPMNRKQKKSYLGITKKTVQNVAKELSGDTKKTTEEIFSYLNEMEISKEQPEIKFLEKDFHSKMPVSSMESAGKNYLFTYTTSKTEILQVVETQPQVKLKIWDDLEAEELRFLGKKSPSNCYEEMIAWTEEGKLWRFPIDNDQGMEKEAENSFTEHVFLERYLEPWCPKKGPIRKFMELVLIGLSKNYLYTIQEKKAHIDWFRKYFEEKKKLLQELGAMGSAKGKKEIGVSKPEETQ